MKNRLKKKQVRRRTLSKMQDETSLYEVIRGKRVLYVATKNRDYIRVNQEIDIIKKLSSSYSIIAFNDKKYLSRVYKVFTRLVKIKASEYDVIVIGFMAQIVACMFPQKFKNNIIVTDFFISIYDTLVCDRKKIRQRTFVASILKWIDRYTIKNSDYLIVDTIAHGQYFVDELGANLDKIYVCYLKADTSIYYPQKIEKPDEYRDKFLVVYFGSILPLQGVDIVMETVKLLENEKSIHFIIIGPIGNKMNRFTGDTVTYIDWLSQKELATYIAFSDLCLAGHFSGDIDKANRTIPGKAYIYKAMNKKMVLGKSQANYELFEEDENTFFVERGNAYQLMKLIKERSCDGK